MSLPKFGLVTLVLMLVCGTGMAGDDKSEAISAFTRGVTSFDEQDFSSALAHFTRAYQLNPSWKLLYNIGHCEAALKHYGMAVATFEKYLSEGGDAVAVARRDEVLGELERMRLMIGDLEIVAPDGLEVRVDDQVRGTTPLPGAVSVTAGVVHKVAFLDEGQVIYSLDKLVRGQAVSKVVYVEQSQTVQGRVASEGQNGNEASATPAPGAVAATLSDNGGRAKLSPVPMIVTAVVTMALAGTTIGIAAYVGANNDDVPTQSDANRLNGIRKGGIVALGATAVAGVATGILVIFTDFSGEHQNRAGISGVAPFATADGGGMVIGGRF